jgi:hypothetical protein
MRFTPLKRALTSRVGQTDLLSATSYSRMGLRSLLHVYTDMRSLPIQIWSILEQTGVPEIVRNASKFVGQMLAGKSDSCAPRMSAAFLISATLAESCLKRKRSRRKGEAVRGQLADGVCKHSNSIPYPIRVHVGQMVHDNCNLDDQ